MREFQRQIVGILIFFLATFESLCFAQWRFDFCPGKASTRKSDLHIVQPSFGNDLTFSDITYSDRSFESPLYYVVRLGRSIPSLTFLRFEAEFIHAKVYSDGHQRVRVKGAWHGQSVDRQMALGEIVQAFSLSHGLNFIFLNVAGQYDPFKDSRNLVVVGRVGFGPMLLHTESTVEGRRKEHFEWDGPSCQVSAGLEFRVSGRLRGMIEYKFTRAWLRSLDLAVGHARTTLDTHHFVFGLGVCFLKI